MITLNKPISTNFSIVLPSQRWEWIRSVLNSILDNAKYPDMIDIHIAINPGESPIKKILVAYIKKHPQVYFYEIAPEKMTFNNQNYPGIVSYINWLTKEYSMGKYIMPMNDDALFIYKDWDINSLKKLPDDIVLGITKDDIGAKGFNGEKVPACSFPIISRKGIEYFGYLFSPIFYHNTADTHITSVYYKMNKTVDLIDVVYIRHRPPELCEFIPTDYLTEIEKC